MDDIKAEFKQIKLEMKGFTPLKQPFFYRLLHPARALHERNVYQIKKMRKHYQNKSYYWEHLEQCKANRKEYYALTGQ